MNLKECLKQNLWATDKMEYCVEQIKDTQNG